MEEKYPVIKGAEAFTMKGNDIGILISHGFMGTPQSVHYIGDKLSQQGYTIMAPKLKGHGTHYKDLEQCTYKEWFQSLEKAYQQLKQECRDIFVIGQSMGGTLALWLAQKYPEIKGIMLINPALSLPAFDDLRGKISPTYIDEEQPDIKAENAYEITYTKTPITAIHELQELMDQTPAIVPKVTCPILGIKSAIDHVVPPHNTDYILEKAGSMKKKGIILEDSYHVATLDNDRDQIIEECHQFVMNECREIFV